MRGGVRQELRERENEKKKRLKEKSGTRIRKQDSLEER